MDKNRTNYEINISPLRQNRSHLFVNEMSDPELIKKIEEREVKDNDRLYFYDKTLIDDSEIPQSYKSIGGKIKRISPYFYVSFIDDNEPYIQNENGLDTSAHSLYGCQYNNSGNIDIMCPTYICKNKDKDKMILFLSSREKKSILSHEIKHALNNMYDKYRGANPNAGPISIENMYRLTIDDEKSAYIAETFSIINAHFRSEKKEMIPQNICPDVMMEAYGIWSKTLCSKSIYAAYDAQKKYLTNYKKVAKTVIKYWDNNIKPIYENSQFEHLIEEYSREYPTHRISDNASTAEPEYINRRKARYTFSEMYNPDTKKMETISLADDIPHTKVPFMLKMTIIAKAKSTIKERRKNLTPDLIKEAQEINAKLWEDAKKEVPLHYPSGIYAITKPKENKNSFNKLFNIFSIFKRDINQQDKSEPIKNKHKITNEQMARLSEEKTR